MMREFEKFWMVYGQRMPTYRHESKSKAVKEAKRLAKKHADTEFYVLETVGVCKKVDVVYTPMEWVVNNKPDDDDDDEIPF